MKKVYGIKNCNTVKNALQWLEGKKVAFEFYDFKKHGVSDEQLRSWISQVGWESLVNKRGTTWRQLPEDEQKKITNEKAAIALMKTKTSIIKRPLIEEDGQIITLGFDQTNYEKIF